MFRCCIDDIDDSEDDDGEVESAFTDYFKDHHGTNCVNGPPKTVYCTADDDDDDDGYQRGRDRIHRLQSLLAEVIRDVNSQLASLEPSTEDGVSEALNVAQEAVDVVHFGGTQCTTPALADGKTMEKVPCFE